MPLGFMLDGPPLLSPFWLYHSWLDMSPFVLRFSFFNLRSLFFVLHFVLDLVLVSFSVSFSVYLYHFRVMQQMHVCFVGFLLLGNFSLDQPAQR